MTFFNPESLPEKHFGKIVNTFKQSGIPAESAPLIEEFYYDKMATRAVYASAKLEKWFKEHDILKLEFGGGEFGITASMLVDVPKTLLSKIKMESGRNLGAKRAKEIIERAQKVMKTEPGY